MINKKIVLVILIFAALSMVLVATVFAQDVITTQQQELGEFLYFDENLSEPAGQSCASCHDPAFAFVDPDNDIPVSEGVIPGLFGGRNTPMSAYAMYAPIFHWDDEEGLWFGGQFWDGRATGNTTLVVPGGLYPSTGDPLADQARGPFLNPVEMANTSEDQVIAKIRNSDYADLFAQECGDEDTPVLEAYDCMALAISAFERTGLFGQFTSKYDAYLKDCLAMDGDPFDCAQGIGKTAKKAGKIFTNEEWQGLQLFMGENNSDGIRDKGEGAMCSACHVADWQIDPGDGSVYVPAWSPEGLIPPVFTDFSFDNLGVPKSEHELLEDNPVDLGLSSIVGDSAENGKFKVMPLRNIADTAPFAHNGFFQTLEEITHFYNTRDVEEEGWPDSEVPETVNSDELGNLALKHHEEAALVAFMKTLSDGYMP